MSDKKNKFDPENTIFLIDGSSFLYRAYYGVKPMHTSKGEPVQAVYSFCRMMKKLIEKFNAKYISIVWDSKGKTTRHEMFENYKATRQAPPSDLFTQKGRILQITDAIGLAKIAQTGVEADDIIYSLGKNFANQGYNVVVVTLDKDLGQMLDEHTFMYDAFKEIITDVKACEDKMGCKISKLPFYFSLLGDTSDNIPGVKGIGEKGALELVNQFDSLESLYQNLDSVPRAKAKKALEENKENAFLSYKLFLLQDIKEIAQKAIKEEIEFDQKNWSKAKDIFTELEFKSLLKELDQDKQMGIMNIDDVKKAIESLDKNDFICVTTEEELKDLCYKLKSCQAFATDTETTGIDPLNSKCIGISVCVKEGTAYYIPFGHNWDTSTYQQITKAQIDKYLKPILEDEKIGKYLHNAKFDMLVFYNAGIQMRGLVFDSLIAARLVAKAWQKNGLKNLSMQYFNEPMLSFAEVVTANKLKDFSYVTPELAAKYSAADAHQTLKLTKVLKQELKQEGMQDLYANIEFPLIEILYNMEQTGIKMDTSVLQELGIKVDVELKEIESKIKELSDLRFSHNIDSGNIDLKDKNLEDKLKSDQEINLASPKQVAQLLFEKLLLPVMKKSEKGTGYSTDFEVLSQLSKIHPVPGLIIKHRELSKLKNTYIDALPGYVNPKTGRIHTTFNQTDVATGRLSSSDPNLQNIPADSSEYGLTIRQAFVPDDGCVFLSADYSQIELRVLAAISGDKNLSNAFLQDRDVHTETASALFGVPFEKVSHEQRAIGKRINFSVLYGMTPFGLSKDLEIGLAEAKSYIEKYFAQYPGVCSWMERVVEDAKRDGFVTTYFGRRRFITEIYEKNKNLYELGKRIAINTKAQGTAADLMKKGMVVLSREFDKEFGAWESFGSSFGACNSGQYISGLSKIGSSNFGLCNSGACDFRSGDNLGGNLEGQNFGQARQLDMFAKVEPKVESEVLHEILHEENNPGLFLKQDLSKRPQILLQIHDELLISVPEHQLEVAKNITKKVLESVVSWDVPLKITMRHGRSWKDVTK